MSQQRLDLPLPPVDVVIQAADYLPPGIPQLVLDAGCGEGRNSIFMARGGNLVMGYSSDPLDIQIAREHAARAGVGNSCEFAVGDVRQLSVAMNPLYDVVLYNEVNHLLAKTVGQKAMSILRQMTKQGGLHATSGYLVNRPSNVKNTEQCFAPHELHDLYARAGWSILHYDETNLPHQYTGQGAAQAEIVFSRARLIAQKPW